MQVNEEIDAMTTIGLDPIEVLVLPRLGALVTTLPLMTFYANVMGLLGGAAICCLSLDIPLPLFFAAQSGDHRLDILARPHQGAVLCRGDRSRRLPRRPARLAQRRKRRPPNHFVRCPIDFFGDRSRCGFLRSSSPSSTSEPRRASRVVGLTTRIGGDGPASRSRARAARRGEVLALVGASGSGKSVLLRTLLGLMRPAAGRIEAFGQDLATLDAAGMRQIERRWGVLFQDGALFSSLTVAENVAVPLKECSARAASARRDRGVKIALVGLPPDAGDKYPFRALRRHAQARRPRARAGPRSRAVVSRRADLGPRSDQGRGLRSAVCADLRAVSASPSSW